MAWCEANGVDYLFGLARNRRLLAAIEAELEEARAEQQQTASRRGGSRTSPMRPATAGVAKGG
jgi:hypothetical protein